MLKKWVFALSMLSLWGGFCFTFWFLISRFWKGEIQTISQWGGVIFVLIWSFGFTLCITILLADWIRRSSENKLYSGGGGGWW